jgi:hypothetical protein
MNAIGFLAQTSRGYIFMPSSFWAHCRSAALIVLIGYFSFTLAALVKDLSSLEAGFDSKEISSSRLLCSSVVLHSRLGPHTTAHRLG